MSNDFNNTEKGVLKKSKTASGEHERKKRETQQLNNGREVDGENQSDDKKGTGGKGDSRK